MDQPRDRSRTGLGSIRLVVASSVLLFGGTLCVSGCGDDQGTGMVNGAKDATKSQDAQDSMKSYMQSMKTKGMKPGKKSEGPAK